MSDNNVDMVLFDKDMLQSGLLSDEIVKALIILKQSSLTPNMVIDILDNWTLLKDCKII